MTANTEGDEQLLQVLIRIEEQSGPTDGLRTACAKARLASRENA